MTDLTTSYLGLALRCPLVASSSPLTASVDGVKGLADAGAGAVVLPSLFEERVRREADERERLVTATLEQQPEAGSYLPAWVGGAGSDPGTHQYLQLLERSVAAVDIPVLASLNAVGPSGWAELARSVESAGAAAIELNVFYLPADGGGEAERRHLDVVAAVRAAVDLPISVKLGPHFSSVPDMARRLAAVGADGLVLFNRYPQPDIDLDTLSVVRRIGLSHSQDARPARAWIAMLWGRVPLSLGASTGVEDADDVAKYLLAGADVVMTASALLRHGAPYLARLVHGLARWMEAKGFDSVADIRGRLAVPAAADVAAFERRGYLGALGEGNRGRYDP